jgi:hypothetical protein
MTDFTKPMVAPNGAATAYHSPRSVEARGGDDFMIVNVASYGSEADFLLGNPPLWMTPLSMPVASLGQNFWRSITTWLLATPTFSGGTAVVPSDETDPVILARTRRWTILKAARNAALLGVDLDANQNAVNTATKAIRDKATQVKSQLDAATTVEGINAVVW